MKRLSPSILLGLLSSSIFLLSCERDSYEKGEGSYSLLQADFACLTVDSEKRGVSFMTDEGEHYLLSNPTKASWIETADTVYRALLYFNKISETTAESMSLGAVPTLRAIHHWQLKEQPEDPLGVESGWLSKNGKYLNLGLLLKTGQEEGNDGTQKIALAQDTIRLNDDQTHTAYFRLLHDQCGVPEYYTSRRYVSILLPDTVQLDTIRLTLPTCEGKKERVFSLR